MAWSVLQEAGNTVASGNGTAALTTNLSSGTVLLALVAVDTNDPSTNAITSVKDTAGNSFSLVSPFVNTPTDDGTVALYALATPSGDVGSTTTITATIGLADFGVSVVVLEVQGIAATPDGTLVTNTGTASPMTNGTYSAGAANEFLVFCGGDNGYSTTYSTPAGWTAASVNQTGTGDAEAVLFYKNSTGSNETVSSTIGAATKWGSLIVAFTLSGPTVTFNANGGSGTMAPQTDSSPTALNLNTFTYVSHYFTGWNTAADGSGTAYADGATYAFSVSATLYAQWAPDAPTIVSEAGMVFSPTIGAATAWVNPNSGSTTVSFDYGTTTGYGSNAGSVILPGVVTALYASETLTGLSANTTYYFRTVATNVTGTTYGPSVSFKTATTPPFSGITGQGMLGAALLGYEGANFGTVVSAGVAAASTTAYGPTITVNPSPLIAGASAAAYVPTPQVGSFSVITAPASAAAYGPSVTTGAFTAVVPPTASASAAAYGPGIALQVTPGVAGASASCYQPEARGYTFTPLQVHHFFTGRRHGQTIITAGPLILPTAAPTVVVPGIAGASAAAYSPTLNIQPASGLAPASATAYQSTAQDSAFSVGIGAASATAYGPDLAASITAGLAGASTTALQPTAQLGSFPVGVGSASATAYSPSYTVNPTPTVSAASAGAYQPTIVLTITPGTSAASAVAYNPSVSTSSNASANAGLAGASASAYSPTITVGSASGLAAASAGAYTPGIAVEPISGIANAGASALAPGIAIEPTAGIGGANAQAYAPLGFAPTVTRAIIISRQAINRALVGRYVYGTRVGGAYYAGDLNGYPRTAPVSGVALGPTVTAHPSAGLAGASAAAYGASASITFTPGVAGASATAYQPEVTTGGSVTATPGLAGASANAYASTIDLTGFSGIGAASTTAFAPSLTDTSNPSVAGASAGAYSPTIAFIVSPSTGAASAGAYQPSISAGGTVVPGTAGASTTAYSPSASVTFLPTVVSTSASAYGPTSALIVTPGTSGASAAAYQPNVSAGGNVIPITALATATAYSPEFVNAIFAGASAAAYTPLIALGLASGVGAASAHVYSPVVTTAWTTGYGAASAGAYGAGASVAITPSTASASASGFSSSISTQLVPGTASASASAPQTGIVIQPNAGVAAAVTSAWISTTAVPIAANASGAAYEPTITFEMVTVVPITALTSAVAYLPTVTTFSPLTTIPSTSFMTLGAGRGGPGGSGGVSTLLRKRSAQVEDEEPPTGYPGIMTSGVIRQ